MDSSGRCRKSVTVLTAVALVVLLVASGTPAAAHGGHGGHSGSGAGTTETTAQGESGGPDLSRIGVAVGAGVGATALAGVVLWLRSG